MSASIVTGGISLCCGAFVFAISIGAFADVSIPTSQPDDVSVVRDWHLHAGPPPSRAAFERLRERLRLNPKDGDALMALARIYADTEFGEFNGTKARSALADAAAAGSEEAKITEDAMDIRKASSPEAAKALAASLQDASSRDPLASFRLGELLAVGSSALPKDTAKAIELLRIAGEHRLVEAWTQLGDLYNSEGREAEALDCYMKAADAGDPKACIRLAQKFNTGDGVKPDQAMAFKLVQRAAQTSPDAVANLAQCYFDGTGVVADPARARALVRQSADQGSGVGATLLAEVYLKSKFNGDYDCKLGLHWLAVGVDRCDPTAFAEAGVLNLTGLGMPRNVEQSRAFFNDAQEAGISESGAQLVDLMLKAAYDKTQTQSAYDEIVKQWKDNHNAAVEAAILLLTENVGDARGLKAEMLLENAKDGGDPWALMLYRLLRDRNSKY